MPKSAHTDAYVSVIAAVKALRLEKGVTQVELARRLKRSQQFVSYLESGVRQIDLVEFVVIVRALGGDPEAAFVEVLGTISKDTVI